METYAYDDGDKLLARSGPNGAFQYSYDGCGRTTRVQGPGGGTTTLSYDYEDRLTSLYGPNVSQVYAYNGADARTTKGGTGVPGNDLHYRRDGVGPTAPVLSDGQATMVPGVSERRNGATAFSHLDRLGTNAVTTDATQGVVGSARYDAFGVALSVVNPAGSQRGFAAGFGYQEDETGLKLLGRRYYDPGAGRFITRDPIGSGTNWYRYCRNNPLSYVDPAGLTEIDSLVRTQNVPMLLQLWQEGLLSAGQQRVVAQLLMRTVFKDVAVHLTDHAIGRILEREIAAETVIRALQQGTWYWDPDRSQYIVRYGRDGIWTIIDDEGNYVTSYYSDANPQKRGRAVPVDKDNAREAIERRRRERGKKPLKDT